MSLRSQVIKLAHDKPELRQHLLPLVRTAARGTLPLFRGLGKYSRECKLALELFAQMYGDPDYTSEDLRNALYHFKEVVNSGAKELNAVIDDMIEDYGR